MIDNTINDAVTIAGGEGTLLANRYRIVRQLGQGGMGNVWLVEDTQLDNKLFAVKMLPAILVANKRAYRQLKDEALVAMRLVHPNIVQIRAFEENDGNPFLVMDYIDGQTLDDYLAEHAPAPLSPGGALGERALPLGKTGTTGVSAVGHDSTGTTGVSPVAGGLPDADVLRILTPIADALDYAHGEGVVHRDVKPANVMIRKDGHPFILDFGIAREIQETITRVTGKLSSGTLLYMSPEQLNGLQPKPAQDIYSFAAMVYECLKGEPPFVRGQIEHQILNNPPEPLPGGTQLVASVMAGLAKKPGDRPATCSAVLGGDVSSRKERKERKDAGGARSRATAAILFALLLAIVGGAWWALSRTGSLPVQETPPPRQTGGASDQPPDDTAGKTIATTTRREAQLWKDMVGPILNDAVFRTSKDSLTNSLTQAEVHWDAGRWDKATAQYAQYTNECAQLVTLYSEWQSAVRIQKYAEKAKDEAQRTKEEAAKIEISESVGQFWNNAEELMKKADKTFNDETNRMRFVTASNTYVQAENQFKECTREAQRVLETAVKAIRQEAEMLQNKVDDILKRDEFKGCKKNLMKTFADAENLRSTNQWYKAFVQFTNYTNECSKLIAVNVVRQKAVDARPRAESAKRDAASAGVTAEIESWVKATNLWQNAITQLHSGDFDAAERAFGDAAERFEAYTKEVGEMCKQKAVASKNRDNAKDAKKKAEKTEAKVYALEEWIDAEVTLGKGNSEFGNGDFTTAAMTFALAVNQYENCARIAAEKKRLKEAEDVTYRGKETGLSDVNDNMPKVRSGMKLDISVTAVGAETPSFKRYFVDMNGYITMELIGPIKCDGMSLMALQKKIEGAYKRYYLKPQVTVTIAY